MKVIWVRNDEELEESSSCRCSKTSDGQYSLTLKEAYPSQSGVFFCEAYNPYGEAYCYCRVNVLGEYRLIFNTFPGCKLAVSVVDKESIFYIGNGGFILLSGSNLVNTSTN